MSGAGRELKGLGEGVPSSCPKGEFLWRWLDDEGPGVSLLGVRLPDHPRPPGMKEGGEAGLEVVLKKGLVVSLLWGKPLGKSTGRLLDKKVEEVLGFLLSEDLSERLSCVGSCLPGRGASIGPCGDRRRVSAY